MSAMLAIGVCACGGVGAAARYICDSYIKALWRKTFPLSTFAINVVAGLLAGLVAGLFAANTISPTAAYCSQQDFSAVSQRSQP